MDPFATPEDIAAGWRALTAQEGVRALEMLAAAASWIRDRKPAIAQDDANARFVSIEVVRQALSTGKWAGHSAYSEAVGGLSRSGTLVGTSAGTILFTDFHKELLGVPFGAMPSAYFGDDAP